MGSGKSNTGGKHPPPVRQMRMQQHMMATTSTTFTMPSLATFTTGRHNHNRRKRAQCPILTVSQRCEASRERCVSTELLSLTLVPLHPTTPPSLPCPTRPPPTRLARRQTRATFIPVLRGVVHCRFVRSAAPSASERRVTRLHVCNGSIESSFAPISSSRNDCQRLGGRREVMGGRREVMGG